MSDISMSYDDLMTAFGEARPTVGHWYEMQYAPKENEQMVMLTDGVIIETAWWIDTLDRWSLRFIDEPIRWMPLPDLPETKA
jgi:hypothetical protein